jgi:hypothetical protein
MTMTATRTGSGADVADGVAPTAVGDGVASAPVGEVGAFASAHAAQVTTYMMTARKRHRRGQPPARRRASVRCGTDDPKVTGALSMFQL